MEQLSITLEGIRTNAARMIALGRTIMEQVDSLLLPAPGTPISLKAHDGTPLHAGDRVRVTGSDRFGEAEGVVRRAIGERANVLLDNGVDGENYTANPYRLTVLEPAVPEAGGPVGPSAEPEDAHAPQAMDPTKVVAGPAGHWYAWYEGELVALPMGSEGFSNDKDHAPPHPALEERGAQTPANVGWYAPEDLQGPERDRVLAELGVAHATA